MVQEMVNRILVRSSRMSPTDAENFLRHALGEVNEQLVRILNDNPRFALRVAMATGNALVIARAKEAVEGGPWAVKNDWNVIVQLGMLDGIDWSTLDIAA